MEQQEHVSEEAAKVAKSMGSQGPDLDQGTPVQDILKEDKEARENAPQVLKDSLKSKQPPAKPQTRPFSTSARQLRPELQSISSGADTDVQAQFSSSLPLTPLPDLPTQGSSSAELELSPEEDAGHKFGLPAIPIPKNMHKDYRYEPIVDQVTNLMMQHGEKAKAQRNMSYILHHLRTASPPVYNTARPLLPGAPPASHLPLHPVLYLQLAIDSLAPLMRIRSQRGAAGGGAALQIPVPLGQRQRRRQAFQWILDAASKKPNRGTGRADFARRIADELIAVVEGRSQLWDRRTNVHKVATTARSNIGFGSRRRR